MFFIRQGIVVVENSKEDCIIKNRPILYLPKFSYFGDYHILLNLKSNLVFRTIKDIPEEHKDPEQLNFDPEKLPTTYFMCIGKKKLLDLCELFPTTHDNIRQKALERRHRFMH